MQEPKGVDREPPRWTRPARGGASPTDGALHAVLAVMRRRWRIVLLCTVLTPLVALAYSATQEEAYEATAVLLFRDPAIDEKLFGNSFFGEVQDPARQAATNLELVGLSAVADRTAEALDEPGVTGDQVQAEVTISSDGESDIADIVARDADPELAAAIANTFAEQYIEFRKQADRDRIEEARAVVQRRYDDLPATEQAGDAGSELIRRSQELEVLASLQTGNAELVERAAVPTESVAPKPLRNTVLGLFLGLILGVGIAFLRELLDDTLTEADEIQSVYGLPVLATVPRSNALARYGFRLHTHHRAADEAFRMLRANLRYFNVDRQIDSLLITSAVPQEGKTTVSWNLALAEAHSGKTVLLIEADMRRPMLATYLGAQPRGGLSLVLSEADALADAVFGVEDTPSSPDAEPARVDVLFAGPIPPNPSELIESDRMAALLAEARETYDLVIIDTPPVAVVADAIPLTRSVSGAIVAARVGQTPRREAVHLRAQLERLQAPVLGLVISGAKVAESYYHREWRQDRPNEGART